MSGTALNPFNYAPVPIFQALVPAGGPKTLPFNLDLTINASQTLDLLLLQQLTKIDFVQAIFVDNSLNNAALTITVDQTNQKIVVPIKAQAYFPLLCPERAKITFSMTGATSIIPIQLLNVPVAPGVWGSNAAFNFDGNGNLLVSDTLLDGAISSGLVQVNTRGLGDGGIVRPIFQGNRTYNARVTAAATTTLITGSPNFFVTSLSVRFSPDAIMAAAGANLVTLRHSTGPTNIFQRAAYLPNAIPASPPSNGYSVIELSDTQILGLTPGSNLELILGTALTGGFLEVLVTGGTTSWLL